MSRRSSRAILTPRRRPDIAWRLPRDTLLDGPETPVALPEIFDGVEEVFLGEIGPEFGGDVHLGVGKLPEEEIGETHLAGGADEEVGVGVIASVEMFAEHVDVDHGAIDVAGIDLAEQAFDAIDDLEAAAVTEREDQRQAVVPGGALD